MHFSSVARMTVLSSAVVAVLGAQTQSQAAAVYKYNAGGAANLWSDAANWQDTSNATGVPGTDPADSINQDIDATETIQIRGTRTIADLTWANATTREIQSQTASTLTITGAYSKTTSGSLTFRPSNSTSLTLNIGSINASAGTTALIIGNGNSDFNLTVSGTTTLSGGCIVTLDPASATLGPVVFSGATASTLNTTATAAQARASGTISVASLAGSLANDLIRTNAITVSRTMNLQLTGTTGSTTYAGQIVDKGGSTTLTAGTYGISINKTGASTQIFTGSNNTYSLGTIVSGGTLLANNTSGDAVGTGQITVNANGRLGGTGFVNAPVTVNADGKLLGGDGASAAGQLRLSNNVTFADGSVIELVVGDSNAHSSLARTGGSWTFDADQAFHLLNITAGTYENIITGLASDPSPGTWTLSNAGYQGTFTYDGANIDLVVSLPEPASATLLLGCVATLLRRRRA